jgi:hypothetical protein
VSPACQRAGSFSCDAVGAESQRRSACSADADSRAERGNSESFDAFDKQPERDDATFVASGLDDDAESEPRGFSDSDAICGPEQGGNRTVAIRQARNVGIDVRDEAGNRTDHRVRSRLLRGGSGQGGKLTKDEFNLAWSIYTGRT